MASRVEVGGRECIYQAHRECIYQAASAVDGRECIYRAQRRDESLVDL